MGFDFHRQPLDNFIIAEDRQKQLECLGIKFLSFQDKDIRFNLDNVLNTIEGWIRENSKN